MQVSVLMQLFASLRVRIHPHIPLLFLFHSATTPCLYSPPPPPPLYLPPGYSLCSSSVTRWLTVSMPWFIFSCWPCVSFRIAWRSFSNIFIFLSSSPSRSSTLQVPFPRPGEALDGDLGAGEAGEAGRRPPGAAAAGGEEALPTGGAGALPALPVGLLLPPTLPPVPAGVSVRFKAAGPISACNRGREKQGKVGVSDSKQHCAVFLRRTSDC